VKQVQEEMSIVFNSQYSYSENRLMIVVMIDVECHRLTPEPYFVVIENSNQCIEHHRIAQPNEHSIVEMENYLLRPMLVVLDQVHSN